MRIKIILLVITVMALYSCKKVQKSYYATGELKEEITVNGNGLRHGQYTRYDIDGSIYEQGMFDKGKQVGIKKIYNEEGILESEAEYLDGKQHGHYKVYYPNGKMKVDNLFNKNVQEGVSKQYFEDGTLKESIQFANNEENGPFEENYKSGKLKWKGTYKDGYEIGLLELYAENGEVLKKMQYDSNMLGKTIYIKPGYVEPKSYNDEN